MRFRLLAIPFVAAVATFVLLQARFTPPVAILPKTGLRIATYNIGWLSENASPERREHLRSVIRNLQPDILAMQEIQGRRALEPLFGDEYQIVILDDPKENQEEALAIKKPLKIIGNPRTVFPDPAQDQAFPGGRDVLTATVRAPDGTELTLYVVHLKSRSGEGGRIATDPRRILACHMLADRLKKENKLNYVVLGDFNDSPEDTSLNDLMVSTNAENLMKPLYHEDYVSFGMESLYRGRPIAARVPGAYDENEKWRGLNAKYPDDFAVTQALFDQIVVSQNLSKLKTGTVGIYCGQDAMEGIAGSATRDAAGNVSYEREGTLASDHLPVYADFRIAH